MSSKNLTEITLAVNASICFDQMKNIGEIPIRGVWFYRPIDEMVKSQPFQGWGYGFESRWGDH